MELLLANLHMVKSNATSFAYLHGQRFEITFENHVIQQESFLAYLLLPNDIDVNSTRVDQFVISNGTVHNTGINEPSVIMRFDIYVLE